MDKAALGQRLAEARDLAGMTQDGVARAVGLDRTAIVLLEKGERNLKVPELVRIARALGRPLSYFVEPPVPAAVSRRSAPGSAHDSTRALDVEIDQFASDVRMLMTVGLLRPAEQHLPIDRVPQDHQQAELIATRLRESLDLGGTAPIDDLGRTSERLGLHTFAAALGATGPDGACIEVSADVGSLGAAVINGDSGSGRRRMTLAHELGHWVFGDAYDREATRESERMINSFAIYFLAPRAGVLSVWRRHEDWPLRDRALAVGVVFRLSWTATISHLRNLQLISGEQRQQLSKHEPRSGDYLRLELSWTDELEAPYLSPTFVAACLRGFTSSKLTEARVLELLRGLLTPDDLPDIEPLALEDLRSAFADHPRGSADA